MKNKILFTVTNLSIIPKIKDLGIDKFVYPLSFFCVGILNTFSISQMTEENSYILVNRVLDTKAIDDLKKLLINLPSNIKGIIFEDVGLILAMQDLKIEKILFNSHFMTNFASINVYLDYVDSVIIASDITEEETKEIIDKTDKEVCLFTFGLISSMYSRRTLLKSHSLHNQIPYENKKLLHVANNEFLAVENEFGTVLYHFPYYDGRNLENYKAKYYFYFPLFLDDDIIVSLLKGEKTDIKTTSGFLNQKTIYKIKKEKEEGQ